MRYEIEVIDPSSSPVSWQKADRLMRIYRESATEHDLHRAYVATITTIFVPLHATVTITTNEMTIGTFTPPENLVEDDIVVLGDKPYRGIIPVHPALPIRAMRALELSTQ